MPIGDANAADLLGEEAVAGAGTVQLQTDEAMPLSASTAWFRQR
jgi:hypothetical protein